MNQGLTTGVVVESVCYGVDYLVRENVVDVEEDSTRYRINKKGLDILSE